MILHALYDLYDRLEADEGYEVAQPGYSIQKISFRIVLQPDGQLLDIQDARRYSEGRAFPRPVLVLGATKPSGSGLNPCFLWDNSSYMLGYKPGDPNPERTLKSFEVFRDRHLASESEIHSNHYSAVCRFLREWEPSQATAFPVLEDLVSGFGVFQIQGRQELVHQDSAVRQWWEQSLLGDESAVSGQCLITGNQSALARLHDKIKGVKNAQSSGATIAGFNEPAYWSYGKQQSFNAPVSVVAAFRYVAALNALLDGPNRDRHRLYLGDTTVVFWTERSTLTEDIFAEFAVMGSRAVERKGLSESHRLKLEAFLQALRQGRGRYLDLEKSADGTSFFLLGLAPNAARISVRFFHQGTLGQLVDQLRRHHEHIRLAPETGKRNTPEFPSLAALLDETAPRHQGKPDREKIPPILAGPLLRAVITGTPYPDGLYHAVIRRLSMDHTINYLRAGLLKGYLVRNRGLEVHMSLDLSNRDPAYRLGRLFAALEKTQKEALPGIKTTVRDSYYGTASASPGTVFPRLLRLYQHHLAKLPGGNKVNREKLVQEIMSEVHTFPKHLDLTSQGLFAIGYYHQTQDFYTSRQSKSDAGEDESSQETNHE